MRHLGRGFMPLAPAAVAALLAAGAPGAGADTLQVTVHPVTTSADFHETTPRLGNDGISEVVVYRRSAIVGNAIRPGDISLQRLSGQGVPMGPPAGEHDVDGLTDDFLTTSAALSSSTAPSIAQRATASSACTTSSPPR
jgi:hypothetical protein